MIDRKNFKLSVIIPCYNEKKTIQAILKKIIESLNNYKLSSLMTHQMMEQKNC